MRRIFAFLEDETGSETIQFVSFVPLFAFLLVIVTDATFLYLTHSEMWNVARDTARRMAAGQLTNEQEAMDHAAAHLAMFENAYNVSASFDPNTKMGILITVGIADAMIFGAFLGPVLGETIRVQFEMRSEPEISGGGGGSV